MRRERIGLAASILIIILCLGEFLIGWLSHRPDPVLLFLAFLCAVFFVVAWRRLHRLAPRDGENI